MYGVKAFWRYNDRKILAQQAGISPANLHEILYRRRGVSQYRAVILSQLAKDLGYDIDWREFFFNQTSSHPAFFGQPQATNKKVLIGKKRK
jgi:hypothetical protein